MEQENTNLGLIPWINWVWKESTNNEQENKHVLQMQQSHLYLEARASWLKWNCKYDKSWTSV